jgi:hypothetical protein
MPPSDLGSIDVLIAFCASVAFVVGYTFIAPWWRYEVGRTMAALDIGISLTLFPSVLHHWFGVAVNTPFFAWYQDMSLLLVAGIALWRLWVVFRVQQDARHNSQEEGVEE